MKRDENRPFVHPGVPTGALDPAKAYAAGIAARRNLPPKDNTPVAGGQPPTIPRLDGVPQSGLTMEQQGRLERGAGITPRLAPADLLPPEARKDPAFRDGQGSMVAMNQPELAAKYGVIRGGRPVAPQQLFPAPTGGPILKPETRRGLEKLAELAREQQSVRPEPPPESSTTATIGNLPGDTSPAPLSDAEKQSIKESISQMDEFQFDTWRQAMQKDLLNNEEQRKIIEARLKPMHVEDMVLNLHVIQRVPVIPGKFEPSFISTTGETDLAIKRLIMEDSKSLDISDRYFLDKFSLMSLCAGLHAINGKPLLAYQDAGGDFNDDLFRKKFNNMLKMPLHMLASLGVHAWWFEQRVRSLYQADALGNG